MNRREFLRSGGISSLALAWPNLIRAEQDDRANRWRTFEVTTRVETPDAGGRTHVWVPLPLGVETPYQKPLGNSFDAVGGNGRIVNGTAVAAGMIHAQWNNTRPQLTVTSRITTRDYIVDLTRSARDTAADDATLEEFLKPTALIPTDGIVRSTAVEITRRTATDLDKARAIYEWIVDNTFRDPKVRGCGVGDIRFMLESRNFGGKCADLNALYVGLARSVGLPARDAYGIRLAKAERGPKVLGAPTANISKAQHCRAEVFVREHGWIPVDPADVRKVVLEEPPGNLSITSDVVHDVRARLFGAWEMNWMAYNFAHDVVLPGSVERPLGFFMYPQAEVNGHRGDSLDPDAFRYEITAREIV